MESLVSVVPLLNNSVIKGNPKLGTPKSSINYYCETLRFLTEFASRDTIIMSRRSRKLR